MNLISEDGSLAVDEGCLEIQWYRSIVLHAGNKAEKYGHESLITKEHIDFIKRHGKEERQKEKQTQEK